ncbi:hypothetical protein [Testudinibacter aquarius]|uniref:Uncharacterized protein n=1 Tax=Testudinibacter aquarius TaxID=1524974 RepID=A0A4R3Y429_9PAST|nr:hypothetical protein [Testudinibacter aquarius]KAE9528057.1 hypothetical protein A1D24_01465 [Testudinibacter aquarius]TCV86516.1 hypothetical protein EDC16_10672 [Testudinibacter aquarius]TNG92638.1 hypothetical protein FHQ21_03835 [Testudinibacter aquarius]
MTRLMMIICQLIYKPLEGVSEKETYFKVHFLNARNEISELERTLYIQIHKEREKTEAGRHYTRYTIKNPDHFVKLVRLFNEKLRYQQRERNRCHDVRPITIDDVTSAIRQIKA